MKQLRERMNLRPSVEPLSEIQVIPNPGIRSYEAELAGHKRTWEEYVPASYDGSKKVPLVLTLHGGANWKTKERTIWPEVAERETFIVVYPHSLRKDEIRWNAWREFTEADGFPDDVAYLDALLELILRKYSIDETRMYIHGQSVGDKMASTYLFERGYRFAAGACMSGSMGASCFVDAQGNVKYAPEYPLPVVRTHGSEDLDIPLDFNCVDIKLPPEERTAEKNRRDKMQAHQLINNYLWRTCNRCEELPRLSIRGKFNAASYHGEASDFFFYCVKGGLHSPSCELADYIWTYFFSAYARVDGKIVRRDHTPSFAEDRDCIALASGAEKAYVNQKLISLPAAVFEREGHPYVPLHSLPALFEGRVQVQTWDNGLQAAISGNGHEIEISAGNYLMCMDTHFWCAPCSVYTEGELYVPADSLAEALFGYGMICGYGAYYLTPQKGEMTYDMAYLIREILGLEKILTPGECLDIEHRLIQEWKARGGLVHTRESLPKN